MPLEDRNPPTGTAQYVAQPMFAYVDFRIAGESMTLEGGRPKHFQEFSYIKKVMTRSGDTGCNDFTIRLIDVKWNVIEPKLIKGWDNLTFRYYYHTGKSSPWYYGQATNYTPSFSTEGVSIEIQGTTKAYKEHLEAKSTSYEDLTVSDIVQKICTKNGWGSVIDPTTEALKELNDLDTSQTKYKTFQQKQESDLMFIKRMTRYAVRTDGVSGYIMHMDMKTDPPTLHFHPQRFENAPLRHFKYMFGDPLSEVKSFAPEIDGKTLWVLGGGDLVVPYIDWVTKESGVVTVNDANTPEKTNLGGSKKDVQKVDKTQSDYKGGRNQLTSATNKNDAEVQGKSRWYTFDSLQNKATMEIVGDPELDVMDIIKISVITPQGGVHYSSGNYSIMGITDTVSGGEMSSTLELNRNAASQGTDSATGKTNA